MRTVIRNNYTPKTRDYCSTIVVDQTGGRRWFFDCDGIFTDIAGGIVGLISLQEGANVHVDNTDPRNPIISVDPEVSVVKKQMVLDDQIDGVLEKFELSEPTPNATVFYNGVKLREGIGYEISSDILALTLSQPPLPGETLDIEYWK